ncbi:MULTISPECIES: OmpA family protein [Sphingomonas]|uniref:OmpA family protein n=1 Tax=Edaphosphingomonas fennica TaxID=114404 RepID=A0A2T4I643_9SPHN|nr:MULTISPECIES: OmpA family protein [Sphingomonas]AGH48426.1 outer mnembrane protein OmpA [Sphingomonas sp. MM-1]PTD26089.1 OmpA family protein [Sphingomonas fennica]
MKLLFGPVMLGALLATTHPAMAQADPEAARLLCDLTGDCADGDAGAATAQEPARGEPRGGASRGFSFRRAPAPGATPQAAQAAAAPAPRTVAPAQPGAANLGVSFLPNSAELTDAAKARLARYAAVLNGPKLNGRRLRIEGHTDASGSAAANRDLSRRRAQAVADFLAGAGVSAGRLEVAGFGSSRPLPGVAPTAPENRRVMAVLL